VEVIGLALIMRLDAVKFKFAGRYFHVKSIFALPIQIVSQLGSIRDWNLIETKLCAPYTGPVAHQVAIVLIIVSVVSI